MSKPSRKRKNPLRQPTSPAPFRTMIPHSSAWFEALFDINVIQAFATGALIDRTKREDGCTFCGSAPALIYDALDAPYLPLRLCNECFDLRTTALGERLQRRPGRS